MLKYEKSRQTHPRLRVPKNSKIAQRTICVKLGSVWKIPARRCAADLDRRQEATTRRIGREIRGGEAPKPAIQRRQQRPRGVFRQSLTAANNNPRASAQRRQVQT